MPADDMKTTVMKVVVFGANGETGRRIVEAIVARGHTVVAAVRQPDSVTASTSVTVVKIDFTDLPSLTHAISGCDAVVSAVGSRPSDTSNRSTHFIYSLSVRSLREAMRLCRVSRLIVLSCDGVEEDGEGPRFVSNIRRRIGMNRYLDIVRMETILEETPDLSWTIVRLTSLIDVRSRPYLVQDRILDRGSFKISYVDVADFVSKELEENKWTRKFPILGYSWSKF